MKTDFDIGIVGGGMVGASLACALAGQKLAIALLEAVPVKSEYQPSYDERGLALSLSSKKILTVYGIWQTLLHSVNPIKRIHVSDRGRFGFVRMDANSLKIEALGYVVSGRELGYGLMNKINQAENIEFICPAKVTDVLFQHDKAVVAVNSGKKQQDIHCKLLVVADGTNSELRDKLGITTRLKDYGQTAIVTNISTEMPHLDTAYERFTDSGPMALLPLSNQRCALVYTVHTGDADKLMQMDDDDFLDLALSRFSKRLGKFSSPGLRKSYSLKLVEAEQQVRERMVLLGNSAHTIHNNAAQGFNLGLRDAAGLAEIIRGAVIKDMDPGTREVLDSYLDLRRDDQARVIRFTDMLATSFYNNHPGKIFMRDIGMMLTDLVLPIKYSVMKQNMGLWQRQPLAVRQ